MTGAMYPCVWTGAAFEPSSAGHARRAAQDFGAGEIVTLTPCEDRSLATHNHQFASIADAWRTLPESLANQPYAQTPDTLRKHALIRAGFCNLAVLPCGSKAAAERVAAYVQHSDTMAHGYCIVEVDGSVVRSFTPHSQSMRAMGKAEFQRSKTAVLEWIDGLLQGEAA